MRGKDPSESDIEKMVAGYKSRISYTDPEKDFKKANNKFWGRGATGLFFNAMTVLLLLVTVNPAPWFKGIRDISDAFGLLLSLTIHYVAAWFLYVCVMLLFHGVWLESVARNIEKKTNGRTTLLWVKQNDYYDDESDESIADKALGRWSFKICAVASFLLLVVLYHWETTLPVLAVLKK